MAQFLRDPAVLQADIIAIQEPWKNPYKDDTHHPAKETHELLYPPAPPGKRTRVCMFVAKCLAPTSWTHIVHSANCQELRVRGMSTELRIVNLYNDQQTNSGLHLLPAVLPDISHEAPQPALVVGDFNLHHPAWGGEDAIRDEEAEELLDMMEAAGLDNWVPQGEATRELNGSRTTIDLVLASRSLYGRMVTCGTNPKVHADSDHLPIQTILDIDTPIAPKPAPRRKWKRIDERKLAEFVNTNLRDWTPCLDSRGHIDAATEHLLEVVKRGIQESTPWTRPSEWMERGVYAGNQGLPESFSSAERL